MRIASTSADWIFVSSTEDLLTLLLDQVVLLDDLLLVRLEEGRAGFVDKPPDDDVIPVDRACILPPCPVSDDSPFGAVL